MRNMMPRFTKVGIAVTLIAVASTPVAGPQAQPRAANSQSSPMVWVNLRSGVYHCRGTQYFANTTRGDSMPEMVARARGYRANGGSGCPVVRNDSTPPAAPIGETARCVLEQVIDGDTVRCGPHGRIRLIGIDAAEVRSQEPFANLSTIALKALAAVGDTLVMEFDVGRLDRAGRTLAYLWKGGRQINWELVRQGFAVSWRVPPNERYYPSLVRAERLAREAKAGLWSDDRYGCLPLAGRPRC